MVVEGLIGETHSTYDFRYIGACLTKVGSLSGSLFKPEIHKTRVPRPSILIFHAEFVRVILTYLFSCSSVSITLLCW